MARIVINDLPALQDLTSEELAKIFGAGQVRLGQLHRLSDDEVIEQLIQVKGIGVWTAQMFLIFALGRPDIWPAADLGLQLAVMECLGLPERPREAALRELVERWRPWRSVASCLFWQSYLHTRNRAAPVLAPELYAAEE